MGLPNGSASGTERLLACPSHLALPRVHRETDYAARGHGIHGYVRAVVSGTPADVALAAVDPEHRDTCRLIDWQKLCGDLENIECEVAYAVDVRARTARLLGHNLGRDYEGAAARAGQPLGEYEIPGSLDLTGRYRGTRRRVVRDLKSGYQDVTPTEENGQVLFFAAVFYLLEGENEIDCAISKLKPSGDIWHDTATFDAWAIDEFLDKLEGALDASKEAKRVYLRGSMPDFSEGPWCGHCSAADACPPKNRLARSMAGDLSAIDGKIESMTSADAGRAYEIAHDRVAPVLERILSALKERARREALPLSGDLELREAPYEKEQPDFQGALALARELGATDEQLKACYKSLVIRPVRACKAPGAKVAKRGRARKTVLA
jgi:hypothetical protein